MIMLRTDLDFKENKGLCSYSLDGKSWTLMVDKFELAFDWQSDTFQGEKFVLFCYNPKSSSGFVDVDSFKFSNQQSAD
jgi:hypothetical protein